MEDVEPGSFGVEEAPENAILAEGGVEEGAVEEGGEHATTASDESGVLFSFAGVGTGDRVGGEGVLGRERGDDEAWVESAKGLAEGDEVRVASSYFSVLHHGGRSTRLSWTGNNEGTYLEKNAVNDVGGVCPLARL